MNELGELEALEGETEFSHIPDWYEWERLNVRKEVMDGTYSFTCKARVDALPNSKGYMDLGEAVLTHDMNGFRLKGSYKGEDYEQEWPVRSLYSCHIEYEYLGKYGDCVDLNMEDAREILKKHNLDLDDVVECEHDAGLGNGGLGRLASCYMDAATTLDYPVTGFSILYEFGIFRQRIIDGWQVEFPDNWLSDGDVWLRKREEDAVEVRFGGQTHEWFDNGIFKVVHSGYDTVLAVPYDLYITGYGTNSVNRLVLWSASNPHSFDMAAFARGDYESAMYESNKAQIISKVLYPSDDHIAGKKLRLQQQYFFVSASLQSILTEHLRRAGCLSVFRSARS